MTTETTPPPPELGPASDNGQVQSHGHRRRRRRRKNKSGQQGAQQPQQAQMQQPPPQQPSQPKSASQHPHQHQHQGRKKKKFFQKSPAQAPQHGNSNAPQHGKRKGKQKGPREFVGPMDHSYRAVNGNVADGPPSTIQFMGSGYNGNYMESHAPQQPIAVRHDAPTRIFCFIEDLFLQAKIQENARKLGVKVEFVKGDKDIVSRLTDMPEPERPTLLVFDLNNLNAKPMALIPKFKGKFKKATSIIGFLHHLQGDLKIKAIEAGCDTVMPRSAFSQSLPNLLRRYGIAEEEEDYAQQPM
ncbi:MAG TPA: response regulator [Terracidiphilus sp.]|nr:response regulator [Terracidiphilus sp.]